MFAKLLKMEFRSTWNVLGILCLSLLGAGVLGGLATRYLESSDAPTRWIEVLCVLTVTAVVLFFVIFGVASVIIQLVRFYRSRFTDEGYLTFTLPVNTHQILLSSFVSSAVNLIAVAAVTVVSLILMGLCAISNFAVLREGLAILWQELPELWHQLTQGDILKALSLFLADAVTGAAGELILMMLAVTIGSIAVKKHKILAAVAFYYILHCIAFAAVGVTLVNFWENPGNILSVWAIVNLIIAVVGYFIMYFLVDKKLNLN